MNHNGQVVHTSTDGQPFMLVRWYNGTAWYTMPRSRVAVPQRGAISVRDWRGRSRVIV